MELLNEMQASHTDLCAADWTFREFARHDPECLSRSTFTNLDNSEVYLKYDPQPWPTFMGRTQVAELEKASLAISGLIRCVPERVFANDPEKIAKYYDLGEAYYAEIILEPPNAIATCLARGDLVPTRCGLKCVEFNMTSNLGGWETAIMAELILRVAPIERWIRDSGLDVSYRNTIRSMFKHVVEQARAGQVLDNNHVNTAIGVLEELDASIDAPAFAGYFSKEYAAALSEVDPGLRGSIFACGYEDMRTDKADLYFGQQRIHCLVERHVDKTDQTSFRCFKAGSLHLYNGPISIILGDKRNLALLSEWADTSRLEPHEAAIVKKYIPWTRRVLRGETTYDGVTVSMTDFLVAEKDDVVIKKAHSLAGKDVAIGRFTPREEWIARVENAAETQGQWIAQEFVESLPYLYQNGEYGCSPHDAVWGPFVFGTTYAGTILRLQPKALGGVVNLTRGATEGIILEVEDSAAPEPPEQDRSTVAD